MMLPVEPPRRPRPGPRHAAVAAEDVAPQHPTAPATPAGTVVVDGEVIRMPGLASLLRRNPKLARHGAVGSIVAGVVLFVVASMTTSVAGANVAQTRPPAPPSAGETTPADTGLSIDPAAPV